MGIVLSDSADRMRSSRPASRDPWIPGQSFRAGATRGRHQLKSSFWTFGEGNGPSSERAGRASYQRSDQGKALWTRCPAVRRANRAGYLAERPTPTEPLRREEADPPRFAAENCVGLAAQCTALSHRCCGWRNSPHLAPAISTARSLRPKGAPHGNHSGTSCAGLLGAAHSHVMNTLGHSREVASARDLGLLNAW